jgi:hypothetical protein
MGARRAAVSVVSSVLVCVLALCLVSAVQVRHPAAHHHPVRGVAAVAATSVDTPQHSRHDPDDAVAVATGWAPAVHAAAGTSDASQGTSLRTARTPLIRGPPDQGRS